MARQADRQTDVWLCVCISLKPIIIYVYFQKTFWCVFCLSKHIKQFNCAVLWCSIFYRAFCVFSVWASITFYFAFSKSQTTFKCCLSNLIDPLVKMGYQHFYCNDLKHITFMGGVSDMWSMFGRTRPSALPHSACIACCKRVVFRCRNALQAVVISAVRYCICLCVCSHIETSARFKKARGSPSSPSRFARRIEIYLHSFLNSVLLQFHGPRRFNPRK